MPSKAVGFSAYVDALRTLSIEQRPIDEVNLCLHHHGTYGHDPDYDYVVLQAVREGLEIGHVNLVLSRYEITPNGREYLALAETLLALRRMNNEPSETLMAA